MTEAMLSSASPPSDDRLLPWSKVRDLTGISRTTAWRLQKAGDFPLPVVISPGRVGWRERELEAWKASRCPRSAAPRPSLQRSFLPLDEPASPQPSAAPPKSAPALQPKADRRKPPENGQLALDF